MAAQVSSQHLEQGRPPEGGVPFFPAENVIRAKHSSPDLLKLLHPEDPHRKGLSSRLALAVE